MGHAVMGHLAGEPPVRDVGTAACSSVNPTGSVHKLPSNVPHVPAPGALLRSTSLERH